MIYYSLMRLLRILFVAPVLIAAPIFCADRTTGNPDVELIDQSGKHVHFYSELVSGHTVAVNFVFTACTTICPVMSANFVKLEKLLGSRLGRDILLISISVDPVNDTPAKLKQFATKFGALPGWTLLTGDRGNVERLLRALGEYSPDKVQHSSEVLIGSGDGRWIRANAMESPDKIKALLLQGH